MIGILKKCIEELEKDCPNVDYVRGMLETLYEVNTPIGPVRVSSAVEQITVNDKVAGSNPAPAADLDEGALLDGKARSSLAAVRAMAEKSTELG